METFLALCIGASLGFIWGSLSRRLSLIAAPPTSRYAHRLPLLSALLGVVLTLLLIGGYLGMAELPILMMGLTLTIEDCQAKSYPLTIWLLGFSLASLFAGPNWLTLFLLILAVLAQMGYLPMGSGDFLYLAAISLILSFQQMIWLIQLASLTGLLGFIWQKKRDSLPFIPFIYVALLIILSIQGLSS